MERGPFRPYCPSSIHRFALYRLTEVHLNSLDLGTVQTTFEVPAAGGQVRNVRVTSTTGNRIDELIARRAIDQLRAPPIPAAILAQLHHDFLVFEETFTIFDNANPPLSLTPPKKDDTLSDEVFLSELRAMGIYRGRNLVKPAGAPT
jgi:hypothetical protein